MGTHSVAEAKDRLPALIAAAERGEAVTITRYGKPVAEIRSAARREPRRATAASVDWIEHQLGARPVSPVDSVSLLRAMRDETDAA